MRIMSIVKTSKFVPKRALPVLLALLTAAGLAAGCGTGTGGASSTASSPAESEAPSQQQPAAAGQSNFNATGFPIVNETVTKKFMLRKPPHIADPGSMPTMQRYEELSNVHIDWDIVSADGFQERLNLVMASNEMPDAILKGLPDTIIAKASADGSIIDVSGLIDQYSVGLKSLFEEHPEIRPAATSPDGKIYFIPGVNTLTPNKTGHRNLWINQKWLTTLGLEVPKTLDEFVEVLRAFRDKDPNGNGKQDEIPYVVEYSGGDHIARVENFAASWGIAPNMGYQVQIKDGKAQIYVTSDKYKEVLQFMNTLWAEKLLDNSLYTQTADVALSKFNSDVSGCFGLSSDDLWSKYSGDYVPLPPPANGAGDTPIIGLGSSYAGVSMLITRADESPEITLRWVDYFYTPEGAQLIGALSPDLEGVTCQKREDGSWDYSDAILGDERGVSVAVGEVCPLPGGGFPYWRNENNSNFIYSQKVKDSVPVYEPYYQKDPAYAYPMFTVEENERVTDIRRDLDIYIKECEAKFITGELSFDKWEEYVATCEKMGIRELEGFFQTAYDRMSK